MSEFLYMGGFAGFVWPAYGLTALVLIGLTLASVRAHGRAQAQVSSLESGRPSSSSSTPQS